jgi:hypothetical protein
MPASGGREAVVDPHASEGTRARATAWRWESFQRSRKRPGVAFFPETLTSARMWPVARSQCASLIDSGMKLIDDETLASPDECDAYLADLQELADVFLARYEALAPVSRTRLMLWEGLDYLRDALQLWTKARPARPEAVTRILEHHWRRTDLLPES